MDDKLASHSLTQKRDAKRTEITMTKSELETVVRELVRATAALKSKIQKRDGHILDLKKELANDSDDDDDDDDD